MRPFRTLTEEDVGQPAIEAFGRIWPVEDFIGQILPNDVGKRVCLFDAYIQVENDEQRDQRLSNTEPLDMKRW